MNEEIRAFFAVLEQSRKMNVFRIVPDIAQNEYAVLKAISTNAKEQEETGVRVSVLVQTLGCQAPMVSRSLRSLEEKGYVMRTIDTKDRRNTIVSLTDEGLRVQEQADQVLREFGDAVFGRMGKEKVHEFTTILTSFLNTIHAELEKRQIES